MDRNDVKRQQLSQLFQHGDSLRKLAESKVVEAMTPHPTCIGPETNVVELIELFHAKGSRHMLVADEEGCLLGVLSDRDVIGCLGPNGSADKELLREIAAKDLMSSDLIWVGPAASLVDAIRLMVDHGISCMPVLHERRTVGILTSTDLYLLLEQLLHSLPNVCPSGSS